MCIVSLSKTVLLGKYHLFRAYGIKPPIQSDLCVSSMGLTWGNVKNVHVCLRSSRKHHFNVNKHRSMQLLGEEFSNGGTLFSIQPGPGNAG